MGNSVYIDQIEHLTDQQKITYGLLNSINGYNTIVWNIIKRNLKHYKDTAFLKSNHDDFKLSEIQLEIQSEQQKIHDIQQYISERSTKIESMLTTLTKLSEQVSALEQSAQELDSNIEQLYISFDQ